MALTNPNSNEYWKNFTIEEQDLEFLYNHLLEIEIPQTSQELIKALIDEKIYQEKKALENQQLAGNNLYIPKEQFLIDQKIIFPALNWKTGTVIAVRDGMNPNIPSFKVIDVDFGNGEKRSFASGLVEHKLNLPVSFELHENNFDGISVFQSYGGRLINQLEDLLENNHELVSIADRWFPRSLLVDVNIGYLNMAEALLEMENGNPLSTKHILDQIELPTDVNSKLTEFSLNHALQEDGRFDEVGPTGEVLWALKRLEPEWVQNPPLQLRYSALTYDRTPVNDYLQLLEREVIDELDSTPPVKNAVDETIYSLIFPHWYCGTIPLAGNITSLIPSAIESPRVRFIFKDSESGRIIPGWVVRPHKYVYGLQDWFHSQGVIPGSLIRIRKSTDPGEVIISLDKKRPTREWIRTAIVGTDGGIVFAMLKQLVTTNYNERMAFAIPESESLVRLWETGNKQKPSFEHVIMMMMRELAKLNPQGHVHVQELYSAVNLIRRCPPSVIISVLIQRPWALHMGDLYFRLDESGQEILR